MIIILDGLVRINVRRCELAGRDLLHKQHVQLFVCTALNLGQAEVGPDEDEERGAAPEEAALSAPVPLDGTDHVRVEVLRDEVDDLVGHAREHDGKGTKPDRRGLGDDTVLYRGLESYCLRQTREVRILTARGPTVKE